MEEKSIFNDPYGMNLLLALLLKYLSEKDSMLPTKLEEELAKCEIQLSYMNEPYRSQFQKSIEGAKRALNEL